MKAQARQLMGPAMADLIAKLSGADGCALYELGPGGNAMERTVQSEASSQAPARIGLADFSRIAVHRSWTTLPFYRDGLFSAALVLWFGERDACTAQRIRRITPLARMLLQFLVTRGDPVKAATRVADLEAGIATQKILERAHGLLSPKSPVRDSDLELVERHVAKVLESCRFDNVVHEHLVDLEQEAVDRSRVGHAKKILQSRLGIGEQEAYQHIRALSRRTRKRIGDVASKVIDKYEPGATSHDSD